LISAHHYVQAIFLMHIEDRISKLYGIFPDFWKVIQKASFHCISLLSTFMYLAAKLINMRHVRSTVKQKIFCMFTPSKISC